MRRVLLLACVIGCCAAWERESRAAFSYTTPFATYSQNFDSLPNTPTDTNLQTTVTPPPRKWIDDTASPTVNQISIEGWYLYHPIDQGAAGEGGTNQHQRMRIGAGGANTGAFMSYGAASSTDRALGSLASNTLENAASSQFIGLRLTNNTGSRLTSFTLSYFGEEWRDGGAATPNAQSLSFGYKLTPSGAGPALQDSGFTAVSTLNFTSPVFANTGAGAAVNGNTVGRVGIGPITVSDIQWDSGTDLWLRWSDLNDAGNDHGLAVDDLNFTAATPEPMSFIVLGVVALAAIVIGRGGLGLSTNRTVCRAL